MWRAQRKQKKFLFLTYKTCNCQKYCSFRRERISGGKGTFHHEDETAGARKRFFTAAGRLAAVSCDAPEDTLFSGYYKSDGRGTLAPFLSRPQTRAGAVAGTSPPPSLPPLPGRKKVGLRLRGTPPEFPLPRSPPLQGEGRGGARSSRFQRWLRNDKQGRSAQKIGCEIAA